MNPKARAKRALLRERRRLRDPLNHSLLCRCPECVDYGAPAPPVIGPFSGYDLFLTTRFASHVQATAETVRMVVDPHYRARRVWYAEVVTDQLRIVMGRPPTLSHILAAMLPSQHDVRVEGIRMPDGELAFLRSDPDRPTAVYARRVG